MTGGEATSAFAGEPQPVEVFHRGVWYSGELLGWRHDDDGRCRARVRCVVDGLRHSAWMDLSELRLPRPPRAPGDAAPVAGTAARPPVPGRHRELDDETQPHILLPGRRSRPRPAGVALPPPRYSVPARSAGSSRVSAV